MTLRALRTTAGLTQRQLASKAGVAMRTIWALEAGTSAGRIDVRRRVLVALGVMPWQQRHREIFGALPMAHLRKVEA